MIEIDQVRSAIEAFKPWEVTDAISDTYWRVLDVATTTNPTPRQQRHYYADRMVLRVEHESILECLKTRDDWFEVPLTAAYLGALAQVDTIMTGQQGQTVVESSGYAQASV